VTPDDVLALSMDELRVKTAECLGLTGIERVGGKLVYQYCPDDSGFGRGESWIEIPDYPNDMAAAWPLHEDRCGVLQTPQKRERYLGFLDSLCRNGKGLKGAGRIEWPAALSFLTSLVITLAYVMSLVVDDCETV